MRVVGPGQFLGFMFALASAAACADAGTTIQTRVIAGGSAGPTDEKIYANTVTGSQSWSTGAAYATNNPELPGSGGSSVSASADFGALKASASSTCSGLCGSNGTATVGFSDWMVIDRTDLHGTTGYITTTLEYRWTGTATNQSSPGGASAAEAQVNLLLSGDLGLVGAQEIVAAGSGSASVSRLQATDVNGVLQELPFAWRVQITSPFAFGDQLDFSMMLTAFTFADGSYGQGPLASSASMQAGQSAYWGGMSVTLADGTPVTDFTLASDSGTNWRLSMAPIPEPATIAMMLAGLALLGVTRGRAKALARSLSRAPEHSPAHHLVLALAGGSSSFAATRS